MFETLVYETPATGVARISLNRLESRNAQNTQLLYELNDAFDRASGDDSISVIILAAKGAHFSSGHDLRESEPIGNLDKYETVGTWCGFGCAGAEGWMAREKELYHGLSERWRNIPKPTIAQVQGKCISGGLMLVWPCDLIIASDDALFADNTVAMGMTGVEYFGHPWELGPRKAKEMLFTSDALSAQDALRLGMVNQIVARDELEEATLVMARKCAAKSRFALKMAKKAINGAQDAQGRDVAMQNAFHLHQLAHTHWLKLYDFLMDPSALPEATRKALGIKLGDAQ